MKIIKILLFNMFVMFILDVYLIFFSNIETIPETQYNSIWDFLSNIDNIILIIVFILAIINGILFLIDIYKNRE